MNDAYITEIALTDKHNTVDRSVALIVLETASFR